MSAERHERASRIFLEVRRLAADRRAAALADACRGDGALRAEVESLLQHDPGDESPHTFETIAAGPQRIGPYRVLERIGRGGSGFVLLAEQEEPIRRRVAIKIVPHAAISPDAAARFDFERRALERTEHPNIARILDAGRTADGLPYLVMEFVDGVSITQFCDEHRATLRQRLILMVQVAEAVQHAHQRGVIHRDIKPANILVAVAHGRPTPRVLDFGIAKPTPYADGGAAVTLDGPLGTPAYMAPEQTGAGSDGAPPADTRADVYALGAVLYELVTGRPPLGPCADTLEMLRRIREDVPPPASVAARTAAVRLDAPKSLRDDLDRVLAKALEKAPARRYATAAEFADDLRALLLGEPVRARPATIAYRASRFARRHATLVGATATVLVALGVGVAGLAAGFLEAERQRRIAVDERDAQQEINRFLTEDLLAAVDPDREGADVTALDLLRRAGDRVDARLASRPLVAASVHATLGAAYTQLGAIDDAERHHRAALRLRQEASGRDSPDAVRSEVAIAGLLGQRQRFDEAVEALEEVVARARAVLGPADPALYAALNDLGTVYAWLDRGEDAVRTLREALDGRTRILGPRDPLVLVTASNLASAYDAVGDVERSLATLENALVVAESLEHRPSMTVLGLLNNIGATLQDLGRHEDAAPYIRRAAASARETLGDDHPATMTIMANLAGLEAQLGEPLRALEVYRAVAAAHERAYGPLAYATLTSRYGAANCLRLAGRFDDAVTEFGAALDDMIGSIGDDHWLTAQTRVSLAHALRSTGRAAEALPHAQAGAARLMAIYGPDHPRASSSAAMARELEAEVRGAP